jgi:hypothetical protein
MPRLSSGESPPPKVDLLVPPDPAGKHQQIDVVPAGFHPVLSRKLAEVGEDVGVKGHATEVVSIERRCLDRPSLTGRRFVSDYAL